MDGAGEALVAMAAYIDLNPVRAGMVKDPKDYLWSGYAEALAGRKRARLGIQAIVTAFRRGQEESISKSLELYRMQMFAVGDEQIENLTAEGELRRGAIPRGTVAAVLQTKGKLSLPSYIRCRVRYFCDGAIFGAGRSDPFCLKSRDRMTPRLVPRNTDPSPSPPTAWAGTTILPRPTSTTPNAGSDPWRITAEVQNRIAARDVER